MKTMKFGIIGCGLMGREFASATLRWVHLKDEITKPEIIGVCDVNPASFEWFDKAFPNLKYHFTDYHDLLACEDIEAVYCAVPHVLHQQVYSDIINAGKHLMGEKPFGMDKAQNDAILEALKNHPEVFCRCASEFPFFPACQKVIEWAKSGKLGQIIEVKADQLETQKQRERHLRLHGRSRPAYAARSIRTRMDSGDGLCRAQ